MCSVNLYTTNISFQPLPIVCHSSLKSPVLNYKPADFIQTHCGLLVSFLIITGIIMPEFLNITAEQATIMMYAYFTFLNNYLLYGSPFSVLDWSLVIIHHFSDQPNIY